MYSGGGILEADVFELRGGYKRNPDDHPSAVQPDLFMKVMAGFPFDFDSMLPNLHD